MASQRWRSPVLTRYSNSTPCSRFPHHRRPSHPHPSSTPHGTHLRRTTNRPARRRRRPLLWRLRHRPPPDSLLHHQNGSVRNHKNKWSDPNTNNMPLTRKIAAGLIAGGVGAAVGNPADVAMVRMQADGRLPLDQRRNYKSVVDAISQMSKNEGIASLWRGSSLTVNRAMLVTASQLASYDQFKEMILERDLMNDGLGTHVTASFAAGFVAAVASNPVDVIKTRVMNMKVEAGMAAPYSGAMDCAMKTIRAEGPMALYKGFIPTISRQGPFTVVLFVTLEQVRKLFKDF
ncbi:hypothetical protein DH2020_040402 [Rehmannia glutinosa]|uniref:Uncharacterized protein n=1 Tax=Rehmannia glutinosa TaxID=99300 RepID=A0ABR0UT20_REHGL